MFSSHFESRKLVCEDPIQSCNTTQLSRHTSLFLANESYSPLRGVSVLVPCNLSCRFCRI